MIIYLAGIQPHAKVIGERYPNFRNVSSLETFIDYYKKDTQDEQRHLKEYRNLILDSGAFSFFNPNKKTDWHDYIEKYCNFINKNGVDLFFEFDIDIIVGLKQVEKYRKKIEQLTNKQPIPVWRPSRSYKYWQKMIAEYPYIAISASGMYDSAWTRKSGAERVLKKMVLEAHKNNVKVHGLGYTSLTKLKYIGWDSVDSTAWLSGERFGAGLYKFENGSMIKLKKQKGARGKKKVVKLNDFNEWSKFSRYAEKNL